MYQYQELLSSVLRNGDIKPPARAGMPGTRSLFGEQIKIDLSNGLPLLTTKKIHWPSVLTELLWFMRGDTNIKFLVDNNCKIWNADAYRHYKNWVLKKDGGPLLTEEEFTDMITNSPSRNAFLENFGDLGPVYGHQWRKFNQQTLGEPYGASLFIDGVDQLKNVIQSLRNNPEGRRHIISAWNASEIADMALPPCHLLIQFNARTKRYPLVQDATFLDCSMYMRSADIFLGVPFNIASYGMLTEIMCLLTGYKPGNLIISFGDVHLYENHIAAATEQLQRDHTTYKLPQFDMSAFIDVSYKIFKDHPIDLPLDEVLSLIQLAQPSHFNVNNYESHPSIKADLSVGV